jgi:hypothetical protein
MQMRTGGVIMVTTVTIAGPIAATDIIIGIGITAIGLQVTGIQASGISIPPVQRSLSIDKWMILSDPQCGAASPYRSQILRDW